MSDGSLFDFSSVVHASDGNVVVLAHPAKQRWVASARLAIRDEPGPELAGFGMGRGTATVAVATLMRAFEHAFGRPYGRPPQPTLDLRRAFYAVVKGGRQRLVVRAVPATRGFPAAIGLMIAAAGSGGLAVGVMLTEAQASLLVAALLEAYPHASGNEFSTRPRGHSGVRPAEAKC